MIDALVSGKLYGAPAARTSKTGQSFATARLRAPTASGESFFVSIVAFSESAVRALLALTDGDSIAVTGELKVSTYTAKDGTAKPSLDLVAHAVLTPYNVTRKRKAINAARSAPAGDFPDDERWLDQTGAS